MLGITGDVNQIPPLPLHSTAETTEALERPRIRATPSSRKKTNGKQLQKVKHQISNSKCKSSSQQLRAFMGKACQVPATSTLSDLKEPLTALCNHNEQCSHLRRLLLRATNHAMHVTSSHLILTASEADVYHPSFTMKEIQD